MVHTFTVNGYAIALDVYSGSVHVADKVSLEAIRLYETLSRQQVTDALLAAFPEEEGLSARSIHGLLDTLDELRAAGRLYSSDEYLQGLVPMRDGGQVVKALCLHVAHACNLTCSYCFAGQGRYQGQAALMSLETGKQALDFLVRHSGSRRHLEVDFFGGEPLLNWQVVKDIVAYGRLLEREHDKVFRFTLTTNGLALDEEMMDFANREMHNVVLSLDGRQAVHDRFRVDHQGRGSYQAIVPKFRQLVSKRGGQGYYIRGTYTRDNLDFLQDVLHMADLGFTQLSMEPVVSAPDDPGALRAEDLPELFTQYEQLAMEMLRRRRAGRGFDFYHYNIDLQNGPCIHKRLSGCGSGTEYLAVTPEGDLYPCHQFVGDERFKLGTLEEGLMREDLREEFRANTLTSHPECRQCWAQLYCAGGCAANACHATGSIRGVYALGCELFKKRLECALMLQAALQEEEQAG
ncbi:MAG: thioether cross-link-forming SCIFF peptide maturase [Clostridiales bacterium]|nr:thioether cross-link-forming SCIFF peptide maturase [Clostridiales bacterium]